MKNARHLGNVIRELAQQQNIALVDIADAINVDKLEMIEIIY